jgi:hypothetical protein
MGEWEAHLSTCQFKRCHACEKRIRVVDFDDHLKACRYHRCGRCRQSRIAVQDVAAHLITCQDFKRCGSCDKLIRTVDFDDHGKTCPYYHCSRCSRKKIAAQDVEVHRRTCQIVCCKRCGNRVRKDILSTHVCITLKCTSCLRRIPSNQLREHESRCEYLMCTICHARLPNASVLQDHQGPCADRAREARYQLAIGLEKVGIQVYLTRGIWGGYRRGHDIEAGKKSLRVRLLDSKTYYPQSPSIRHVMNTWSNNPYTTVIADFEYHSSLLPCMKHEGIFEIALANANGHWIIPPTSINHGISTLELCEKANTQWHLLKEKFSRPNHDAQMPMWHSQVTKYYGSVSHGETPGLSWDEIADIINQYTKVGIPEIRY